MPLSRVVKQLVADWHAEHYSETTGATRASSSAGGHDTILGAPKDSLLWHEASWLPADEVLWLSDEVDLFYQHPLFTGSIVLCAERWFGVVGL
jgi:hypothetical protein